MWLAPCSTNIEPMSAADAKPLSSIDLRFGRDWPIIVGFAAMALPALWRLVAGTWSREDGAEGVLILALGLWLLWRDWPNMRAGAREGQGFVAFTAVAIAALAYIAGRVFDYITLEAGGVYLVGV